MLFLDPFGLQCTWPLLQSIRSTEGIDVVFLVSLSGLFRQAALSEDRIDEAKAKKLTAILGTNEWRQHWYRPPAQQVLFGSPPASRREPGWEDILDFMTMRLRGLFTYVSEPKVLAMEDPPVPLFALYIAVSKSISEGA